MKKILVLNPLKDLPYWGLTTHGINVFPRLPEDKFVSYAFFSNPSFAKGALRQLPYSEGSSGVVTALREVRWMWRVRPDILYGTGAIMELVYFDLRPRRAKYVIAWHGPYDKRWLLDIGNHSFRAKVSYYVASCLLSRTDLLVCDSEFIAASLRKHFPEKKVVVVLNGVDGVLFDPKKRDRKWLADRFSIPSDRPIFVFMGHLIRRKHPEIFAELARRTPEAFFVLAGKKGYYGDAEVAKWEKEAPNLHWFPPFPRDETAKLLASADALIFPSEEEPFGLAVVEALASGIPVIALRSGALPELVRDGEEGFLIKEDGREIEAYHAAVRAIVHGGFRVEKMKDAARQRAALFAWEGVAARYEKAFSELMAG